MEFGIPKYIIKPIDIVAPSYGILESFTCMECGVIEHKHENTTVRDNYLYVYRSKFDIYGNFIHTLLLSILSLDSGIRFVGGCVRDLFTTQCPDDFDVYFDDEYKFKGFCNGFKILINCLFKYFKKSNRLLSLYVDFTKVITDINGNRNMKYYLHFDDTVRFKFDINYRVGIKICPCFPSIVNINIDYLQNSLSVCMVDKKTVLFTPLRMTKNIEQYLDSTISKENVVLLSIGLGSFDINSEKILML